MDIIRINVRGTEFLTYRSTILNLPESTLAEALSTKSHYESSVGAYFFDRSAECFSIILKAHQKKELHITDEVCMIDMAEELEYWRIPLTVVAPCCMGKINVALLEKDRAKAVREEIMYDCDKSLEILRKRTGWQIYRIRLWMFMQIPVYSGLAKAWSLLMAGVLVGSLFTFAAHFDKGASSKGASADISERQVVKMINTTKWRNMWMELPNNNVLVVDGLLNGIILADFITRFILCPYKCQFIRYFFTILDIVVLTAFWAGGIIFVLTYYGKETQNQTSVIQWIWLASLVLQIMRPFRLFGLAKNFVGLRVLLLVLRKSFYDLLTVLIFFGIGMILFAFLIFAAEISVEGTFKDVWEGCWWSIITMTTVGYGDMHPRAWPGYFVAMCCAFSGVIITGLSIPILSTNFSSYYRHVHTAMLDVEKCCAAVRHGEAVAPGPVTRQQAVVKRAY
ncbi:potassium voltage-gated channel subfamily C member 1-like [Lineus longissimus]|uniref:potassium voltage-gated channel subfamily C member 1-like n=1 Tax=Lineus longissimus TaxID=88925 RepID=UPI00315DE8EB